MALLALPPTVRIYVASDPVDLRRGFDGLAAATREIISADPLSGHLFVFINRRSNRMKVLLWERSGYILVYKRLERGTFQLPRKPSLGSHHIEIESSELSLMMEGIDLRGSKRRKRWSPQNGIARASSL